MARPGQATGYKIGELKIRELRNKYVPYSTVVAVTVTSVHYHNCCMAAVCQHHIRCEEALGSKFSVSDFHDVVLSTGSAPLSVLERQMQRYIDDNKA